MLKICLKNILSAVFIAAVGLLLFNLAFILAAFVINIPINFMGTPENAAPHIVGRVVYIIIVGLISWLILKSKLTDLIKAAFFTVPLMVTLVMIGITVSNQPMWVTVLIGMIIVGAVLWYIYKRRLSWYYSFSTLYVAVLALCIMIFRIEI